MAPLRQQPAFLQFPLPTFSGHFLLPRHLQAPRVSAVSGYLSSDHLTGRVSESGNSRLLSRVETAMETSQAFLLREQRPEGYWVGELIVDATLVADTVAYHHWNRKVEPEWQRKA